MPQDRIRLASLRDKIVSAEEAASYIKDGMILGMSGFTRAGEAKAVPMALAARAKDAHARPGRPNDPRGGRGAYADARTCGAGRMDGHARRPKVLLQ